MHTTWLWKWAFALSIPIALIWVFVPSLRTVCMGLSIPVGILLGVIHESRFDK